MVRQPPSAPPRLLPVTIALLLLAVPGLAQEDPWKMVFESVTEVNVVNIEVVVTDINDNPNEGVEVEYEVEIGSGRLRNIDEVTDRRGESTAEYVAGRMPGKVSIKVTVRSTVPTEEEMNEARTLATAVTDYDFF